MAVVKLKVTKEYKKPDIVRLSTDASEMLFEIMQDTHIGAGPLVSVMIKYVAENGYEIMQDKEIK